MVSGTVHMTMPVSLEMNGTMTVLLRYSLIWLIMVCLTWLDSWKQLMAGLWILGVPDMTAVVLTLLAIILVCTRQT